MNAPTAKGATTAFKPFWARSIGWLLLLGPFFFISYGYANHYAAARGIETAIYFDWEKHIPFIPWTIVPYWSIDLLYGLSFLLCRSKMEVDRHALRLASVQIISITFFLLAPLRFAFARPHADGGFGYLFDLLISFDMPYNQAPSLHIGLLIIIWGRFAVHTNGWIRRLIDIWAVLIGISVLTTYQHHFIDIPTGAAVAFICMLIWPISFSPKRNTPSGKASNAHIKIACYYFLGAAACTTLALAIGGAVLWLCWLGLSLLLVCFAYLDANAERWFQKSSGKHSLAAKFLYAPYRGAAWLNSRIWTWKRPDATKITDDVWLGRHPASNELMVHDRSKFSAIVDLCPELSAPDSSVHCISLPWLDLIVPTRAQLIEAAKCIETARQNGPTLVCCALGLSRSACAVIAWLFLTERFATVDAAIAHLRQCRPQTVLRTSHINILHELQECHL